MRGEGQTVSDLVIRSTAQGDPTGGGTLLMATAELYRVVTVVGTIETV